MINAGYFNWTFRYLFINCHYEIYDSNANLHVMTRRLYPNNML